MQLFYVERVTSFVACAFVLKALLFLALCTEDVERLCFCSIERMPRPLSNFSIAEYIRFSVQFRYFQSHPTTFHFQFDSILRSAKKVITRMKIRNQVAKFIQFQVTVLSGKS